jgi:hypothetical protein
VSTLIIGFGYKARNGKDTAAAHLIGTLAGKYDVRRYAFGDELKVEMYDALLDPFHPYWNTNKDYLLLPHPTGSLAPTREEKLVWVNENKWMLGKHLQWYGTEFRRKADNFYWVKKLAATIQRDHPQIALITDVRFPNEFYWVKAQRGYNVKCTRLGFEGDGVRDTTHVSETALDGYPFDFEITAQDGDVKELTDGVVEVFNMIVDAITPKNPEESLLAT